MLNKLTISQLINKNDTENRLKTVELKDGRLWLCAVVRIYLHQLTKIF